MLCTDDGPEGPVFYVCCLLALRFSPFRPAGLIVLGFEDFGSSKLCTVGTGYARPAGCSQSGKLL